MSSAQQGHFWAQTCTSIQDLATVSREAPGTLTPVKFAGHHRRHFPFVCIQPFNPPANLAHSTHWEPGTLKANASTLPSCSCQPLSSNYGLFQWSEKFQPTCFSQA
ncbi:hypothetical protein Y1Q_0007156 [Alligator mississippiensis]|uniref:Uncharacterized protein n=1 Tax=Alligator mississippiensis TaxID=8496 RepID=A0A151N5R7_ALLMI|nr:hypothetical protein Y1Q_0007156 [Alligator mississippiensis]